MSGIISLAVLIIPFLIQLYNEYGSAKAQAAAEDKQFKLDQAAFNILIQNAVNKMQADLAKQTQGADNAWDAADKDSK